jgi:hypothetical protein
MTCRVGKGGGTEFAARRGFSCAVPTRYESTHVTQECVVTVHERPHRFERAAKAPLPTLQPCGSHLRSFA